MTKKININKISFSDFNENLLFGANITGSIGNFDIPKKISNNEALSIENLESMKFQKELNEYEKKINEKKEEKFHFNFKGEVTENQSHHTNDSNDLEIYFLSDEDIKNKCRFYSNNNYVFFENNNCENVCYLNRLMYSYIFYILVKIYLIFYVIYIL